LGDDRINLLSFHVSFVPKDGFSVLGKFDAQRILHGIKRLKSALSC